MAFSSQLATTAPRRGRVCTNPSRSSSGTASRSGTRETSSSSPMRCSGSRLPCGYWPRMMRSRTVS